MNEPDQLQTVFAEIQEQRIADIRDELIRACYGLHDDDETFLFVFLDYLHLLFQPKPQDDPLAFTLWVDGQCRYSSFRDLHYTRKYPLGQDALRPPVFGVRIAEDADVWLAIHRVKTDVLRTLEQHGRRPGCSDFELQENVLSTTDAAAHLAQARSLLGWQGEPNWGASKRPVFVQRLLESIVYERRLTYPVPGFAPHCDAVGYETAILPMLDSFRSVLDEVYEDIGDDRSPIFRGHMPDLGNIFAAVRTVQSRELRLGSFPYTAGLLLSNNQRLRFREWCSRGCRNTGGACPYGMPSGTNCADLFEQPLGCHSRAVADVILCSGIIDFGRKPDDGVWDTGDSKGIDRMRRVVERCVYPADASLYYFPVHINGLPWLVLFTFSPTDMASEGERWQHNFDFYRNATRKAVTYLRWRAEDDYVKQLALAAFDERISWHLPPDEVLRAVNRLWDIASRVFPFPRFQLDCVSAREANREKTVYPFPDIPLRSEQWGIRTEETNPYFGGRQVEWRKASAARLAASLARAVSEQTRAWHSISLSETSKSLAYSAHLLNTPLATLRARIGRLADGPTKTAVLSQLADLESFTGFSMAIVGGHHRDELRKEMQTIEARAFSEAVNKAWAWALGILSDSEVLREPSVSAVAASIFGRHPSVAPPVGDNNEIAGWIRYHETQLRVVLMEVLVNACRAMVDTCQVLSARLHLTHGENIALSVTNVTRRTPEEIAEYARRANTGSADLLGVMNIRQACLAMGFPPPKWYQDQSADGRGIMRIEVTIGLHALTHKELT